MSAEWVWWVDNGNLVVAYDNGDGTFTAPGESGLTIRAYCTNVWDEIGADVSTLNAEDPVPAYFHKTIVDGAIADGYMLPGRYGTMAEVYVAKFERGIASAQAYASREQVQDGIKPKPCIIFGVDE